MLRFAPMTGPRRDDDEEDFAAWVKRVRMDAGYSLKEVERRSGIGGRKITGGYVSKIENGGVKNPSPPVLKSLARGLGRSEAEVRRRAEGKAPPEDDFTETVFYLLHQQQKVVPPSEREFLEKLLWHVYEDRKTKEIKAGRA